MTLDCALRLPKGKITLQSERIHRCYSEKEVYFPVEKELVKRQKLTIQEKDRVGHGR